MVSMINNKMLGASGEELACGFLADKGYTVLHRNFRCRTGEIDIVARDGDTIVFVEVKTRTSDKYGAPYEAVGRTKQNRIVRTALLYMQNNQLFDHMCRFDILEIIFDEDLKEHDINHITDAFQYSGRYGY